MLRIDCNGHTVQRSSLCMSVILKLPTVSLHSVLPPGEERRDKEYQPIRGYVRLLNICELMHVVRGSARNI